MKRGLSGWQRRSQLKPSDMIEGPTRFDALPEAMPRILAPGGLCHVITYET